MKKLTVIIPTYNRKGILKKCLNALFNQAYPQSDYEIIVIDDGSTDGTEELVKSLRSDSSCVLRYFRQEHRGPAATRNVGIENANGKIILFIGDDIIATSTLLEEHSKWHRQYPDYNIAVLGYVTWAPEITVTPFMEWLEKGGGQFAYNEIARQTEVDFKYFFSSNVSVKTKFLKDYDLFFDESFPYAAYEDLEFSYRLHLKGVKLFYNADAIGYHEHLTNFETSCQRMRLVGKSAVILASKHSIFNDKVTTYVPLGSRILHFVVTMLLPLAKLVNTKMVLNRYYKYEFLKARVTGCLSMKK